MAEVYYPALVCNLSVLQNIQTNKEEKNKRISAPKCLMLPPSAMITSAQTQN